MVFGMLAKAGNHELRLDTAEEFGGKDGGFRPMHDAHFLAGCSATDIIHILKKAVMKFAITALRWWLREERKCLGFLIALNWSLLWIPMLRMRFWNVR